MHVLALMMRRVFVSMLIDSEFNPVIGGVFAELRKKKDVSSLIVSCAEL
jgi:hypothetical protein